MRNTILKGNIIDVLNRETFFGELEVEDGFLKRITRLEKAPKEGAYFICPGFIDSHVHVESSMLVPSEFAKLAVVHGTTGSINDPHEIANVCGMQGVLYMIENGNTVPFKFHFGAPSCVPATAFETAGAMLNAKQVETLMARPDINYLSEMMNFPGVLHGDEEVLLKIAAAKKHGKPVDGHAPGLRGEIAKKYIAAGISTDHECFTEEEALDKLQQGMKILIREGSAAKNFDALIPLMHEHWEEMMFCSDDKHPDSLVEGHINHLCKRAVAAGIDVYKVLQAACINPVLHYQMRHGLLRQGDAADFVVLKDLKDFEVLQTFIDGELVAQNGESYLMPAPASVINQFDCKLKMPEDFSFAPTENEIVPVIEALDGQLITNKILFSAALLQRGTASSISDDVLKIVVVNRYHHAPIAKAFIKNFGLKQGAIASSVAHDSHNIVAVGVDDESICRAVNLVIEASGGVSAVSADASHVLALPVAGLMSTADGYEVAEQYTAIDHFTKETLGASLASPFMTLSFMALLVIPHLKLSDKGLFDGDRFSFV